LKHLKLLVWTYFSPRTTKWSGDSFCHQQVLSVIPRDNFREPQALPTYRGKKGQIGGCIEIPNVGVDAESTRAF
jgi:hypothetical protein